MEYRNINNFDDKTLKNEDYVETIRGMTWDLHDKGISYASIARECNICSSSIRNFANCIRNGMNKRNWEVYSHYIEDLYNKIFS